MSRDNKILIHVQNAKEAFNQVTNDHPAMEVIRQSLERIEGLLRPNGKHCVQQHRRLNR